MILLLPLAASLVGGLWLRSLLDRGRLVFIGLQYRRGLGDRPWP